MKSARRSSYPPAAMSWLIGNGRQRVLDVGSGDGAFAAQIAAAGHQVLCVERDPARVRRIADRMGTRLHVAAAPEALPFETCRFDVVSVQESVTRLGTYEVLGELARVLRPEGHLAVIFNTRDDSVPWVKRLARLIQQADPTAMRGDYGRETLGVLEESNYFYDLEHFQVRNWIPITRQGLLEMVTRRPAIGALDDGTRDALLRDVGAIYDTSARAPDPLLLPFQASCWRARVDHTELTMPMDRSGLRIAMHF